MVTLKWSFKNKFSGLKIIGIITVLALFMAVVAAGAIVPTQAAAKVANSKAWTYLVYIAADNDLDTWGDFSLELMKKGLTNDQNVNVVVLYDHYGVNADLLRVTSAGVVKLKDYGEPDMADPAVLRDFLSWGTETFPASHYTVVIWSHGGGWKYIIQDSTSGTRMSIEDLGNAMNSVSAQIGRKFDITIFDACLMSLVEVADQLVDVTDYVVASEQSVPYQGFPYDAIIQRVIANPSISDSAYSCGIADDYYNYYVPSSSKSGLSITSIDEGKLEPLVSSIDDLSNSLIANMAVFYTAINSARGVAQHLVGGTNGVFWYVDLHRFADKLIININDSIVDSQAAAVIGNLSAATYERHSHNLDGTSYGLGINFPPNLSRYEDKNYMAQNYQNVNLVFTNETHWDEMLLEFYKYK
jgi:hypothetical protein